MGRRKDEQRIVLAEVIATPMRERGEQDGRLYWRVRTRDSTRRTVGKGWWTPAEAQVAVAALVTQGIPSSPSSRRDVRTVGDLLVRWTSHQEQRQKAGEIAERSLTNYRQSVRYWRSTIDDVLIERLTRVLVEDQVTAWQAKGVAPRTCKLAVDVLAAAVKWGEPRGHVPRPAPDLRRLSSLRIREDEHVNNDYTPTRQQAATVISHVPEGRDRDIVAVLALTGCRVGEAAALTVGDVDLTGRVLTISGRDPGRRRRGKVKPRRWPIQGELAPLLRRLAGDRPPDEYLIGGLPVDCSDMTARVIEQACAAAGVPRFTAHGLRRLVAMELLEVADARSVSELTGHSVTVLLKSYVRPTAERLRDVVSRAGVGRLEQRGQVIALAASGAQNAGTRADEED